MIVKNPTDKEIAIQYKGVKYSVAANGQADVPAEVAEHWKSRVHEFITIESATEPVATVAKAEVVEEIKVEEKEEKKETKADKKVETK